MKIFEVFFCQCADTQRSIRQADALTIRNAGACNNLAADRLAIACFGNQFQLAIVDEKTVARLNSFQNFRMRKIDAGFVAKLFIVVEREGLACNECDLCILELANAQLWTLKVGQNTDRATQFLSTLRIRLTSVRIRS